jgi:hypothetical protein
VFSVICLENLHTGDETVSVKPQSVPEFDSVCNPISTWEQTVYAPRMEHVTKSLLRLSAFQSKETDSLSVPSSDCYQVYVI